MEEDSSFDMRGVVELVEHLIFLKGSQRKFIERETEEYKLGVCRAFVHFWIS